MICRSFIEEVKIYAELSIKQHSQSECFTEKPSYMPWCNWYFIRVLHTYNPCNHSISISSSLCVSCTHKLIYIYIIQQLVNKCRFSESTLLNYAYPCRNWTFQRFARAAQKKGCNGTNKKSDTRWKSNPGPRLFYLYIYIVFFLWMSTVDSIYLA